MTRTIDQMIASEVLCCMSSLVALTAEGTNFVMPRRDQPFTGLCYQAAELAAPIDDWEEAAIQAGWKYRAATAEHKELWARPATKDDSESLLRVGGSAATELWANDAEEACRNDDLEPIATEVYEHWAVTDWFADKLEAAGEKIDHDFAGLCVWARTTTGQQIAADGVVQRIYAQTHTGLEG